jgi:hypothetical protein
MAATEQDFRRGTENTSTGQGYPGGKIPQELQNDRDNEALKILREELSADPKNPHIQKEITNLENSLTKRGAFGGTDVRDYRAQHGHGIPGGGSGVAAVPAIDVADTLTSAQQQYEDAIVAAATARKGATQAYLDAGARVGTLATETINATTAGVAAKSAEILRTGQLQIEQQVHNDTIAAAVGLNRDAQASRVAATARVVDGYRTERTALYDDIAARQGVGFFDNPLMWLVNQTILPGAIAQHNAIVDKEISATNMLDRDSAIAQDQFKLSAGTAASVNAEILQNRMDQVAAAGRIDASKFRRENEIFNAQLAGNINALAHQAVLESGSRFELEMRKKDREERDVDKELNRKIGEARLKDITDKDKAEQKQLEELKQLSLRSGGIDLTVDRIKMQTKDDQDLIASAMSSNGRFGTSAEDALRYFARFGQPQNMKDKSAEFGMWANSYRDSFKTLAKQISDKSRTDPKLLGKKPIELENIAAQEFVEVLTRQSNDISLVNANSPYRANHERLKIDPMLQGNPMIAAYESIAGVEKDKTKITDAMMLNWVIAESAKNSVPLATVSTQIAAYYKAAGEYNNLHRGLIAFNLPLQKQYNWGLEGNFLVKRQVFDLADPQRVSTMIVTKLARDRAAAAVGEVPIGAPGLAPDQGLNFGVTGVKGGQV